MTLSSGKKLLLKTARPVRSQDVFATTLYTGKGAVQKVTSAVNLKRRGGILWTKNRNNYLPSGYQTAKNHFIWNFTSGFYQTVAYTNASNISNQFIAESDGYTVNNTHPAFNASDNAQLQVGWIMAQAKRFLHVVNYTGDGTSIRRINHNLAVAPGMIVIVRADTTSNSNQTVYHRSAGNDSTPRPNLLFLNTPEGPQNDGRWGFPTDTYFEVRGSGADVNASGVKYSALVFAHDTSNKGIIQCGSYANNGNTVTLGWRPQFVMRKRIYSSLQSPWEIFDSVRGWGKVLFPNSDAAEGDANSNGGGVTPSATGFTSYGGGDGPYLWMAIREPM